MHWMKAQLEKEKELITGAIPQTYEEQDEVIIKTLSEIKLSRLRNINIALDRLHRGEIGICTVCGEQISEKRLQALITATKCINCAD